MIPFYSNTIQLHVARLDDISDDYQHLVLKRADNILIYPGIWQVITGQIEPGETAVHAALRELTEETGIVADKIWSLPYIATFFNNRRNTISASPCFGVIADYNFKVQLSSEHTEFEWLTIDECIKRVPLPSHKDGARIFHDYILMSENRDLFSIKLNK